MADFRIWPGASHPSFNSDGLRGAQAALFPGPALELQLRSTFEIALWGGGPAGEKLVVMPLDPTVATIVQIQDFPMQSIRKFRISATATGVCRIEARLPDRTMPPGIEAKTSAGPSWANMSVTVAEAVSPNEELLSDFGPDAPCRNMFNYIDNVQSASYDVTSGEFNVLHANNKTIQLDFNRISSDLKSVGAKPLTYYVDKTQGIIFPRIYAKACVPNLADMIAETEEAKAGAEFFQQFGRGILDLLPLQGPSGSPTGPATSTGRFRLARRATGPAGAVTIKLSAEEYAKALAHVFPSHSLNNVASLVDGVGAKAAAAVSKDPRFLAAWAKDDMKMAGTLYHSAAAQEIRKLPPNALPSGWKIAAERTLKSGKGGGRADVFIEGPAGQIVEIDWKTSGHSALTSKSVKQMEKHVGQIRVEGPVNLSQESRSWLDYVIPHMQ